MPPILTDSQIRLLLAEQKPLPADYLAKLKAKRRPADRDARSELRVTGENGHKFILKVRQNPHILLDFSIILVFVDEDGTEYRLLRYNGKHPSEHTNRWERQRGLPDSRIRNVFHIHRATERYQIARLKIDGFAEETSSYASSESALRAMILDNNFTYTSPSLPGQKEMFGDS